MDPFSCSKNSKVLYDSRMEYSKQLCQLCWLQIPNRNHVKNPGTDSIFESSMKFKGVQTFWEKSDKFSKILPWLRLHKSEFSWAHLYVRIRVTKQMPKGLGLKKEKSLNLKFKPYGIYKANQICKDFIQDSEIHSELQFKQCSCYSDTRGATDLPCDEASH
jgi:hypothetical protein